jgi:hypothetical protein
MKGLDDFGLRVEKSSVILFDKKKTLTYETSQVVLLWNQPNSTNKRKRTYSAKIWLLDGK